MHSWNHAGTAAAPAAPGAGANLAAKPAAAGARRRRALGDISNAGARPRPAGDKVVGKPPKAARRQPAAAAAAAAVPQASYTVRLPVQPAHVQHLAAAAEPFVDMGPCDIVVDSPAAAPAPKPAAAAAPEASFGVPLHDVDSADVRDAQACVEYIGDIMEHLFESEERRMPNPDYMTLQPDLRASMRKILLSWINEVHLRFKLEPDTLYLTANVLDRYLGLRAVSRRRLQLFGTACLLVASKVEDIWAPEVDECCRIAAHAFTREQLLYAEIDVLRATNFNLTIASPRVFAQRFVKVAGGDARLQLTAEYLLELAMLHYSMIRHRPSTMAAAAVYMALRVRGAAAEWNDTMQHHSRHTLEQILPVAEEMTALLYSTDAKHEPVSRKYRSEKFHAVARDIPEGVTPQ